jgi:hypothetical protein|tara:strand:- start:240 stop:560 length:321 start_codon:yes stop_codon:yes gene_type:complete
MRNKNNIITGIIFAITIGGIIILSIEYDKSFTQVLAGYILFIFPAIFISSFNSKILSFALALITLFIAYFLYSFKYYDTTIGIILAIISGGGLYYYRVSKAKVFKK